MFVSSPTCPTGAPCPDPQNCAERPLCRFRAIPGATISERRFARGGSIPPTAGQGQLRLQVVRSGMAAASATMADGRRQIMCFLVPGDVICPFELAEAECAAEALTEAETWEVALPINGAGLNGSPALAPLLFELSHGLLERALVHVVRLGRYDGTERLCAFLLDLAWRTGRRHDGTWQLSLPMSREDIADYLGLNSETVSRILTRIKKDGIARFRSPNECEIPDLARLEARVPLDSLRATARRGMAEQEIRP